MGMVFSAGRLLVFGGTAVPFDADATGTATAANANVASPASTAMRNRVIQSSYEDVQKHPRLRTSRDSSKEPRRTCDRRVGPLASPELLTGGLSGHGAHQSPT